MSFADLGLSDALLKAVAEAGYDTPTPIQEKAIPVVLMGRDVLGCAQTGTGKTAGFTLPMLDILAQGRAKARMPRSLILEPTRELAAQVAENFDKYGKYQSLSKALLIGGESFVDQQKVLQRGVDVLIATPGRLLDLFERGKILLSDCKLLVIDEADRMLDMGFIPDIERIVSLLPVMRQTLFFSATMPPEIKRLADKFLSNPKEISVSAPATTSAMIEDRLVEVGSRDKEKRLCQLILDDDVYRAIIFCNRKRDVDSLHKSLKAKGLDVAALHGDLAQEKRNEVMDRFRQHELRILVASDVAARGLDVNDVSHVFNYDVPIHADDYVHRIGRTGRAGLKGKAYTLSTPADEKFVDAIERTIKRKIVRLGAKPVVTAKDVKADPAPAEKPAASVRTEETPAPVEAEASPAAADSDAKPRRSRSARKPAAPASETPRPSRSRSSGSRASEKNRPESKPRPVPAKNDDGPFGDHMPAFLMQPARN